MAELRYSVRYTLRSTLSQGKELMLDSNDVYTSAHAALLDEVPEGFRLSIDDIRQLDEPWVHGDWYDLHGPGDVMVFETSIGNRFQDGDIKIIRDRLIAEGFKVSAHWNGMNQARTLSFRVSNRAKNNPMLTEDQKARICAPRGEV